MRIIDVTLEGLQLLETISFSDDLAVRADVGEVEAREKKRTDSKP